MQDSKADIEQDEKEKCDREQRLRRIREIDQSKQRVPLDSDSTESRSKQGQEDISAQDSVQQSVLNVTIKAGQKPTKHSLNKRPLRRPRLGIKSVPVGPARRTSRTHKHSRIIQTHIDEDSQRDSIRKTSTSLKPILSALMDKENSQKFVDTEETTQEANVEAIRRLEEFAITTINRPFNSIVNEFTNKISSISTYDSMCTAFKQNDKKNRYKDIVCLDSTRVILRDPDGEARREGNYIHANYVSSDELRTTYILAQGPKKETVIDFWHMVWQVQCPVIIMLCDNTENRKKKCVQYLPPNYTTVQVPSSSGKMTIRASHVKKHSNGTLIETKLTLTEDGKELQVKHWKWTGWNDFFVPREFQTVFRLLRELRHAEKGFPIVHCSAGVGRSGTLISLEVCLAVLRTGRILSIVNCVEIVRRQRAHSVQTSLQYVFLYRALLEMAAVNDVITLEQIKEFRLAFENMSKKNP